MNCEIPAFNAVPDEIRRILSSAKTIAVVGISPKPERPSHGIALYLKDAGYKIIGVNPGMKDFMGERVYASLAEIPEPVDIVDIFRAADAVPGIVDEAIATKAKVVWMQTGIVHNEAAKKAKEAGLQVVMNKCIMVEHSAL
jgi:predicted CoA-binding protein